MNKLRLHLIRINVITPEIREFIVSHRSAYYFGDNSCEELDQDNMLFKIFNENKKLVGFCLLNIRNEPDWKNGYGYDYEVEIGIINDFKNRGYATECISNLLTLLPSVKWNNANLLARVYDNNPDKKDVENVLYKCGFKKTYKIEGLTEYTKALNCTLNER